MFNNSLFDLYLCLRSILWTETEKLSYLKITSILYSSTICFEQTINFSKTILHNKCGVYSSWKSHWYLLQLRAVEFSYLLFSIYSFWEECCTCHLCPRRWEGNSQKSVLFLHHVGFSTQTQVNGLGCNHPCPTSQPFHRSVSYLLPKLNTCIMTSCGKLNRKWPPPPTPKKRRKKRKKVFWEGKKSVGMCWFLKRSWFLTGIYELSLANYWPNLCK